MAVRSDQTPLDEDEGVTVLQEEVLALLEAAGLPTDINDRIVELIRDGERRVQETGDECESPAWDSRDHGIQGAFS